MIDDESSRLKHFLWEELDENFLIAVIFRSGRRYVVQRHFEQQLLDIKSSSLQNKWRRCLLDVITRSSSPIYITLNEVELMHEIYSWHLNYANNYIKLRENIDYIIDFENLIDCFNSLGLVDNSNYLQSFMIQPVTTLDEARKNIEKWKNLQETINENNTHQQTIDKRVNRKKPKTSTITSTESAPLCDQSSTTGWLQLDSKIVPFIKKQCDRLLSVDYLLKEHIISSSEDFSLRPLYIPIEHDDICTFNTLIRQSSSSLLFNSILTKHSSLITLDHLIFRLKRLFFIRFLSSPINNDYIDYHKIMSFHGGLLTIIDSKKQHLPFIYINKIKYIPQLNNLNSSLIATFCIANKYELEYLRLISLYDYLASDENDDILKILLTTNNLTLIPIDYYCEQNLQTTISLNDFHYHEYQRRTQQQKNLNNYDDNQSSSSSLSGWWQPPTSSKQKRPLSHFKLQRPIFF
ncbi:unnamed protein product [Adineta steineri]|uniref:Uncharacterized protein n=1 Tax=Adineta steineri TaxID=433720 RepID=A0A815C9D4_9BILA|nr:unnamed protein product [Adineta steineri]CAF3519966.1 unnamed protein product [Adineta steineri]